jgi:spore maturation protein CgeB
MKIGFYMSWPKGSLDSRNNVIGDELYAESMCKALRASEEVEIVELYAPGYEPKEKLDIMVYVNLTPPIREYATKHVLYMQNAYPEGSYEALKNSRKHNYDGYAFISNRLLDLQKKDGFDGIFLPFGVDTSYFNPKETKKELAFEVAYIGNDIKGDRTDKYLLPGAKFNFGLYGTWPEEKKENYLKALVKILIGREKIGKYFNWNSHYKKEYKKIFPKISLGKIKQDDVPALYSSARINLNCTAQDCVDWDVITLRAFEVLACRGFLISDRTPIAEKLLADCAVFTDGDDDLAEKIRYYLRDEEARKKIAENGYNYFVKNATIDARAKELLEYIKTIIK